VQGIEVLALYGQHALVQGLGLVDPAGLMKTQALLEP
jgi:hypothetical protein